MQLSQNVIGRMLSTQGVVAHPILQVLRVIPVTTSSNNAQKRNRVILSDGTHHCQGMLATQNNKFIDDGVITDLAILNIEEYMTNMVGNQTIIILLKFEVMGNTGQKIGSPVPYRQGKDDLHVIPQSVNSSVAKNGSGGAYGQQNQTNSNSNPYSSNNYANNSANNYSSNPIARTNTSNKPITPISALNMYQNRWTIKARVTNKGEIRHWSNAKGEGSLFSVELLDASKFDIKATFFKEAVDKFEPLLEMDKVYSFSGGRLKAANIQYNNCKSDFEITFDQNAEIVLESDTGEITEQNYELKPIAELENVEPNSYVDVIGVIRSIAEPATIVSKKSGKELQKCELTVGDDSGAEVNCTIWGQRAMSAPTEFANFPVVAFRRARVSDFGGRTLSASGGNGINIHPKIPEADRIRTWWESGGNQGGGMVKKLTSSGGGANRFPEFDTRKSIAAIKNEGMGQNGEKPDWVSFKGTFTFIKSDRDGGAWYPACPNAGEPCKNRYKVEECTGESWHCERCQKTYDHCMYRFIFSATVSDGTSTTWVSLFDDQAKVLLNGMTADELNSILKNDENGGQEGYDAQFTRANFTDWVLTCKVKQETHQGETRTKTSIQSIHPVDYVKEGRSMLNAILAM